MWETRGDLQRPRATVRERAGAGGGRVGL